MTIRSEVPLRHEKLIEVLALYLGETIFFTTASFKSLVHFKILARDNRLLNLVNSYFCVNQHHKQPFEIILSRRNETVCSCVCLSLVVRFSRQKHIFIPLILRRYHIHKLLIAQKLIFIDVIFLKHHVEFFLFGINFE